jgi:hypothetical protein
MYTIYGLKQTRITLYAADGVTPNFRVTLQKEVREGLTLSWPPEGVSHDLGSGADWAKHRTHRGFRPRLEIGWDFGLNSSIEAWTGAAWGAAAAVLTPIALAKVYTWGMQNPCLVEPHLDKAYSFLAQPDPEQAFELRDIRGVAHTGLALTLIATLLGPLPDWEGL